MRKGKEAELSKFHFTSNADDKKRRGKVSPAEARAELKRRL